MAGSHVLCASTFPSPGYYIAAANQYLPAVHVSLSTDCCLHPVHHLFFTVPEIINASYTSDPNNDKATITWAPPSERDTILRYIVEVRKYVNVGPGRETAEIISGYPQELPGTQRDHTVESLGETYGTIVCSSY